MLVSSWWMIFGFLATFSLVLFTWAALRLLETLHAEVRLPLESGRVAQAFRTVMRSRLSVGYMLAAACVLGALFGFINSVQQVFTDIIHALTVFWVIFACIAIGMAVSSLLNSRIVERLGVRAVSHRALVGFIVAGSVHLVGARSGYESIATLAALQGAMMFCFGMIAANSPPSPWSRWGMSLERHRRFAGRSLWRWGQRWDSSSGSSSTGVRCR